MINGYYNLDVNLIRMPKFILIPDLSFMKKNYLFNDLIIMDKSLINII